MKKEKCFECEAVAEHLHHIVPQVKGGTKTIPLCKVCHGKVHSNDKMSISYLTKLGLYGSKKKQIREELCLIFWAIICSDAYDISITDKSIWSQLDHKVIDLQGWGYSKDPIKWIRKRVAQLRQIHIDDLLDIFEDILQLKNNSIYSREVVAEIWADYVHQ
ncbi:MAG: hypothetical protein BWY51_00988 [Parcubacteria group bacterium ADurb.Bin316]|nr:MAG: hypothetical protein BWY51_00988 [Parcubacteria group bacterium ADurb.Bin316]